MPGRGDKTVITNRRARHDYLVLDTFECGIVLEGAEVKSIRDGRANLQDAYARIEGDEVWLHGMHVSPYAFSRGELDPVRRRKLLLHRKEIERLIGAVEQKGLTLVPLELYFSRGKAKVKLALGRGKKVHDRREDVKRRDAEREMARARAWKGRV